MRPSWRDHADRPAPDTPPVPGPDAPAFYGPIGAFQGAAYARNAFAQGTQAELAALAELVPLSAGTRLLDVGCGDARHVRALASRGVVGTGVDVSPALLDAGRDRARDEDVEVALLLGDARDLPAVLGAQLGTFDVAWSLCQGALGTSPVSDPAVVAGMAAAVRPGGVVVLTVFHALFAARHLAPGDALDPVRLLHHQVSEVRGTEGRRRFDLWTSAYTAREAAELARSAGLQVEHLVGCEPGRYDAPQLRLDDPELLLVCRRP